MLKTAKACGLNPTSPVFNANLSFCYFSDYRPSVCFCRLSSRNPIYFEASTFFNVAVTAVLDVKAQDSSPDFFLQTENFLPRLI